LNGHPVARAPGILNLTFGEVEGEALFTGLVNLLLATGAEPSSVLRALGRDTQQAQSSLRFSLGWGTTADDIDFAIAEVRRVHTQLWSQSPARPAPLAATAAAAGMTSLGEAGSRQSGTWVRFALQSAGGFVKEARVQVFGCPHTAAACQLVAGRVQGQALTALQPGTPEEWRVAVGAPVEKLGRMLIIEDALAAFRPA
jgi:hypothetical protein